MEAIKQKTPYELLEEAGWDLYECHTEEEIQKFKKYNIKLTELDLPKVTKIMDYGLTGYQGLTKLSLPKVKEIGTDFLKFNPEVSLKIPSKSQKKILSADIAELDKEEGLTTTEISKRNKTIYWNWWKDIFFYWNFTHKFYKAWVIYRRSKK